VVDAEWICGGSYFLIQSCQNACSQIAVTAICSDFVGLYQGWRGIKSFFFLFLEGVSSEGGSGRKGYWLAMR